MEEADYIWMDGETVAWDEAQVHALTHALHYGSSVFEGIRAYDNDGTPAVFRFDDHMDRFVDSATIMGMDQGYGKEEMMDATADLIRKNELEACYIRPLAFRGYGSMGLNPLENPVHVMIAVWPWGAYLGEVALAQGVDVITSSWARHHPNVMPTKAKVAGNYVNSILARQEAVRHEADEAIMLTPDGYVAEGTGENLFLVRDNELYTPSSATVLEGVTRDSIITLAEDLGYTVHEERITRDQVLRADEAFFTGTAAEVTPIRTVDGTRISDGCGPVTEELQSRFIDVARGEDDSYLEWRYPVQRT